MDCHTILRDELIEGYLRQQLDEAASDEFETHVLGCPGCTRLLEEMQSLRDGLQQAEPGIRTSVAKRKIFGFRWQAAAVAFAVILAVSAGLLQLRKGRKEPVAIAVPPQLQAKVNVQEAPPTPAPELQTATSPLDSAETPKTGKTVAEVAHPHQPPPKVGGTAPASQSEKTIIASSPESAPKPGGTKATETASAPAELPAKPDNSTMVAKKTVPAPADSRQIKLTSAQGVELFRIGAVEAAPFSFSGFGGHAKDPKGGNKSFSPDAAGADTGRALFRTGMNAYVEGKYEDAIGFLQTAALKDKKSDDINFYLGVSQILAGHPQEAAIPLGKVIALGNSAYLQSAHYYLGKAYTQQVKLAEAEAEFRAAAALPGRVTADSEALLVRIVSLRTQLESK